MDRDHRHQGGFSNGFLLGALVGGSLVFLLGTKKGKEVLKMLTENGLNEVSELKELLQEDPEGEALEEYIQDGETENLPQNPEKPNEQKTIKRFFKRVKK